MGFRGEVTEGSGEGGGIFHGHGGAESHEGHHGVGGVAGDDESAAGSGPVRNVGNFVDGGKRQGGDFVKEACEAVGIEAGQRRAVLGNECWVEWCIEIPLARSIRKGSMLTHLLSQPL